jgi:hypothetical protein
MPLLLTQARQLSFKRQPRADMGPRKTPIEVTCCASKKLGELIPRDDLALATMDRCRLGDFAVSTPQEN